jgi:hypothetical protein
MKGQCLCRRVTVTVDQAPDFINACNCRLCRSLGAAWGYYPPSSVTVEGSTASYRRDDLGYEPWSEVHFCPSCGATTHFVVIHPDHEGIGVNTRLFDQDALDGIEMRYYDSRRRSGPDLDVEQTGIGRIGDGCAF